MFSLLSECFRQPIKSTIKSESDKATAHDDEIECIKLNVESEMIKRD